MTPLPKRRWSTHRQGVKRASFRARFLTKSLCGNCGEPKPAHTACPKCGFYRGKAIIKIKEKKTHENQK